LPKYKIRATVFPNAKLAGPAQQNAKGVERAVEGFCTEAETGLDFFIRFDRNPLKRLNSKK
jgi:hypothetical protein